MGIIIKYLPWLIFISLIVGGGVFSLNKISAQSKEINSLQSNLDRAVEANSKLVEDNKRKMKVLNDGIIKERSRTSYYRKTAQNLRGMKNSSCSRESPAIMESLRLRKKINQNPIKK